ncbi:IS3 family transposase [Patescibacteria group bacterium]|nr:IS3 family transposase [Patescibacteria group bacterium]
MINKDCLDISLLRQAELLDISRSSIYYNPIVSETDIRAMNAIDKIYTNCPFYGHRRIKPELKDEYGIEIGKKKIIALMKKMGLAAIYPQKKISLSDPNKDHRKFPYLLRDTPILRPNHVWGTDITYIRMRDGFAYLAAILDLNFSEADAGLRDYFKFYNEKRRHQSLDYKTPAAIYLKK